MLCTAVHAMPHDYLGFEKDDVNGILLSIEMISQANAEQERLMKSNKGAQAHRRARMRSKQSPRKH